MRIRKFVGISVVVCSCLALVGCSKKEEVADTPPPPPVPAEVPAALSAPVPQPNNTALVVEVNGERLTRGDVDKTIARIMSSPQARNMPAQMLTGLRKRVESQTVEEFVGKTVLLGEASKREIAIKDEEVAAQIEKLGVRLPEGVTLEQALSQEGMTLDDLKADIADGFKIRAVIDACTNGVAPPTDAAISAYYSSNTTQFTTGACVQARHILVECKDADATVRAAEIEGYRKQILDGGDFAALAKEHSSCPSGAKSGGDLGTFERGSMVPPFEEAAFSQKLNEVGDVVETQFGYHIIEVLSRQTGALQPLADVRDGIADRLDNQNKREAVDALLASLKQTATIKYGEGVTPVE